MKFQHLLVIVLLFTNCGNKSTNNSTVLINSNPLVKPSEEKNQVVTYEKIVNNNFAKAPFGKEITPESILSYKQVNFEIKREVAVNPYDDKLKDTILTYSAKNSYFRFYKTANNIFFEKALLLDSTFRLKDDLGIGAKKEQFLRYFHAIDNQNDTLCITDDEDLNYQYFIFIEKVLKEISINMYVD